MHVFLHGQCTCKTPYRYTASRTSGMGCATYISRWMADMWHSSDAAMLTAETLNMGFKRSHFPNSNCVWRGLEIKFWHRKHNYSKDEQNKRSTRSVRIRPHAHVWPKIERTERDRHFQNSALPRRESEPSDTNMEKIRKYIINQR